MYRECDEFCEQIDSQSNQRRTVTKNLHGADKVGVHLARSGSVAIVVHQLISYHFVELIFDGLERDR